ncbi:MAG TPA: hypothetical protein VEK11_10360 [Thermoanaerobaculia bacterium]|nr:hypothetical protein [Thermoanaerobaculia bacterium]
MKRAASAAAFVFAAGYLALLLSNACMFAAGPDSSGYLNEARLLAAGKRSVALDVDPSLIHLFTPYGFMAGRTPGTMVPTYPAGTPLHFALAAAIGGWQIAPFVVSPLAATASLFLFALVARRLGASAPWSIVAAVLLAAFPMVIGQGVQPVSDVLAMFWALATIYCALRSEEHRGWAIACGVAFAIGVAVRPTNILLALPLLFAMRLRPLAIAAIAALPFGLALAMHHHALYGSVFASGYGGVGQIVALTLAPPCAISLSKSLLSMATPLLLIGFFNRRKPALLLSWFGVFFVFYSFYSFCPDFSSTRFLLPALPALILGFVLVLSETRFIGAVLVLIVLAQEIAQIGRLHVLHLNEWESIYPRTVEWVDREVPRDAVVLSSIMSGAFYFHSPRRVVRWDQLTPETTARLRADPRFAMPWYAVASEVEGGAKALRERIPGEWQAVHRIRDVTVWRLVTAENLRPD